MKTERREIAERTKAEREAKERTEALRESEERYKTLFESAGDAILILEVDGEHMPLVVDCNKQTLEIFGCEHRGQMLGKTPLDFAPPVQPDGQRSEDKAMGFTKAMFKGDVQSFEWVHLKLDKTPFLADVSLQGIKLKGKFFMQAVVRDITERKKREEAQRLVELGKLVSNIGHKVNNPLMIISGMAQLCLEKGALNDDTRERVNVIFKQSARAKEMIQRLLVFAKPFAVRFEEHDINEVIEGVVGPVECQFNAENITIERAFSGELPPVRVDKKMIQDAFVSFLNNSKEAIVGKKGYIKIITSREKDQVKIEFRDNGCGILKDVLKYVYDPFFTTKASGAGLGLSTAYGIIKAHGGNMKITSAPGKDTAVTVLLNPTQGVPV